MNETQRRIKAYKAALPGLRERVIAVALLLAMSVAMMTSATFAWLTISRAPEVSGVNTTVAGNGNLEIALAQGNGTTAPGESKVGDSSATENQTITGANVTWGNLVNLSDPSYGLENLTLRPAQLNTSSLLDSPLYGAMYGEDGRITQLSSNFGYATWNMPTPEKPGYFGVSDNYGVRAISSTKIEAVGAEVTYVNMVTKAKDQNLVAANMYVALGNNNKYMPSLATMMGLYMTARMNPSNATLSNPDCKVEDIQNLRDMYAAFLECFAAEAQAMASLVNLQLFLLHGDGNYTPYTAEMIYATTTAKLKAEGVQITNLDQFIKDRNTIASDYTKLVTICQSGTSLKWSDSGLVGIVNNLVDVGKCTIGADNTPISSIGASNAMGYLSGTQEARITNGILYRFEERTGGYIQVKNLSISATVERKGLTIPATVKANIQTTAPRDYNLFTNDLDFAMSLNKGDYKGGVAVAEDTYGLAIDLWIRTNAPASYLTLEGNVLTEEHEIRATATDANGKTVELYTVTISGTDEEGNEFSYTQDVYPGKTTKMQEDGTIVEIDAWIKLETHTAMSEEELGDAQPMEKMTKVITVTGFEGENRVWDRNNSMISVDATTQGSGSCYVYYADTPEDQARSLKLLEAFNVAFVGDDGKLIGKAIMNTERFYAANGRVIVPLILDPSASINLGEDFEGNVTYGLMALEQNVATRITAIVYLDGTKLTNQEVLAAADIHGQLNIQFGSSQNLSPIGNETLESAERKVSASVDKTTFDYDTATEPMTTNVTVKVDGDKPSTVTAFFLRAISSTQGSREKTMTFTQNESGDWVSSYTFDSPGKYVLRTVRLDGVDYDLENPPVVNVSGFAISSLSCSQANGNHVNVMTADNSSTVDMQLKFAADSEEKLPKTVAGRYLNDEDGSAVNVDFTYNATTGIWSGSATFLTSGDYTMQYLVLDGEYVELDSALWQTVHVTLGMRVAVYTTSPHSFKFLGDSMEANQKLLGMQVKIMDNTGDEMRGLYGVKLTYGMKGSGIKKMDTDLTWNGSYYVGELTTTGPGIWQFSNVVVGDNTLTTATTYPIFTIQSPEPPEYYAHRTATYFYAPNNDAAMNAQITHSSAATVQAYIIKDGAAEGTWVNGTIGNELTTENGTLANHWSFKVPTDANGYQDGHWKLTQLRLWDVFAADGTAYTEEAPLEIDVSNTNNVTKVVSRIYVTFAQGQSRNFGQDAAGNVTGAFMDSYTISSLNVEIKDFEGQPVTGVSDVMLEFIYGNNSQQYGGYTSTSLTNAVADFTIALTDDGSHTKFVQTADKVIQYAGSYATTFSFKVSGTKYTLSGDTLQANAPVFTVRSVKPTVTIESISPNGTHAGYWYSQTTGSGCNATTNYYTENKTSSYNQYSATIWPKAAIDSGFISAGGYYTKPTLTLRINNITNFDSATVVLPGKGDVPAVTYTFDPKKLTVAHEIGLLTDGKSAGWSTLYTKYYGHGEQKITSISIQAGNYTYTVKLEENKDQIVIDSKHQNFG